MRRPSREIGALACNDLSPTEGAPCKNLKPARRSTGPACLSELVPHRSAGASVAIVATIGHEHPTWLAVALGAICRENAFITLVLHTQFAQSWAEVCVGVSDVPALARQCP